MFGLFRKNPAHLALSAEDWLIVKERRAATKALWAAMDRESRHERWGTESSRAYAAAERDRASDRKTLADQEYRAMRQRLKERARAELEKISLESSNA